MDFRDQLAEATLARTHHDAGGAALEQSGHSGCVLVPGGQRVLRLVELPCVAISTICVICAVLALPLSWFGALPRSLAFGLLLGGFAISLVFRKVKFWILRAHLRSRPGGLLKVFPDLPSRAVGLENGKTYKKTKLMIEDEGVCLLDARQRRVLIEGCSYRYAIYGRDIASMETVSGYALGGVRIRARAGEHEIDVVLMPASQGPLASLEQAFAPGSQARELAKTLQQVLGPPRINATPPPPPSNL